MAYTLCVASLRHNVQYMCNMLSITKATVYIANAQVINIPNTAAVLLQDASALPSSKEGITTSVTYIVLRCDAQVLTRNS